MSTRSAATELRPQPSTPSDLQFGETQKQRITRLFREHNGPLVRFLKNRLHSHEEAMEVAQEAYVQLLGLDHPETVVFMRGYLYRTAANLASNRVKQRIQRRRNDEQLIYETEDQRSPERLCETDRDIALVMQALYELPASCREAFRLVRVGGMTSEQVGKKLDMHPRQVRRYVARALAHCLAVVSSGA